MCVIVVKPADVEVEKATLEECYRCNSHGAGFSVVHENTLKVFKGFFKFDDFYKAFLPFSKHEAVIHFRIKTHGKVDEANCHPFMIQCDAPFAHYSFAVAHNGTLDHRSTEAESDTNCFVQDILAPLFQQNPFILDVANKDGLLVGLRLLEAMIGKGGRMNKMAIMRYNRNTGSLRTYMLNGKEFNTYKGSMFSNHSYVIYQPQVHGYGHCGMGGARNFPKRGRIDEWFNDPANRKFILQAGWVLGPDNTWTHPSMRKQVATGATTTNPTPLLPAPTSPITGRGPDGKEIDSLGREVDSKASEYIKAGNAEGGGTIKTLFHLSMEERVEFRRIAFDFVAGMESIEAARQMTPAQRINYLRGKARTEIEEWHHLDAKLLDIEIIKDWELFDSISTSDKSQFFYALLDTVTDSQEAAERREAMKEALGIDEESARMAEEGDKVIDMADAIRACGGM